MPKLFVNFVPNTDVTDYGRNGTDVFFFFFEGGRIFGLSSSSALLRSTPSVLDTLGPLRENKTGAS